jgi:beta-galactosidase/beta-glucuronidase
MAILSAPRRSSIELAGPWHFQIDQDNLGEAEGWQSPDFDHDAWCEVTVPGAWDHYSPALWGYEGVAWYATHISPNDVETEEIGLALWQELVFPAVGTHAKVWLNGHFLGDHTGSHLPFSFPATPSLLINRQNVLIIRVDNAPRPDWLPGTTVIEWVQYGGILQPVTLLTKTAVAITHVSVTATPIGEGADIAIRVTVVNRGTSPFSGEVFAKISPFNRKAAQQDDIDFVRVGVTCGPGKTEQVSLSVTMDHAARWSPATPHLQAATVELRGDGNLLIDREIATFGVRAIEVRGTEILLNGEPLQIRGFNRYDEYGSYGRTVPEDVIREDLLRIKRTGANTIRVHYPQDPIHLKIMDEIGLLLIEEICFNWWRCDPKHAEAVVDAAERDLEAMIERDANHPCLIAWSMINESDTNTEIGITAMRRLLRKTRELDPTRLTTFVVAGDLTGHDACDEVDFLSINLYFGLFHGDKIAYHIDDLETIVQVPSKERLIASQALFPGKPLIVGEFGTHGIHGPRGDARFTEDYQAAYIEAVWAAVTKTPGVSGGILWCWADYYHRRNFIGTDGQMLTSPFGPYGVVTVDRKDKVGLRTVTTMFGGDEAVSSRI